MSAVVTMVLVFLISAAVFVVSAMGIGGHGVRPRTAGGAQYLQRAAEHLNGEAEPPRALARLFKAV